MNTIIAFDFGVPFNGGGRSKFQMRLYYALVTIKVHFLYFMQPVPCVGFVCFTLSGLNSIISHPFSILST